MYTLRTSSGYTTSACTLDTALNGMGQHLMGVAPGGTIHWTISTYGDQSWDGDLEIPVDGSRDQAIGDELDHINARLVLAHLAGVVNFPSDTRLHTPVAGSYEDWTVPAAG
ncbi:hypothetical protein D1871_11830 [Nakamurella silvestris]|nr:hypothetical protein D1871_11830 [Nakamurella silvestris]